MAVISIIGARRGRRTPVYRDGPHQPRQLVAEKRNSIRGGRFRRRSWLGACASNRLLATGTGL